MLLVLQGNNTQMCPMVEIYMHCSMNKQRVEGVQNGKKTYLMSRVI